MCAHMCECVFVYVCVHAEMIDKHTDDCIHHAAFIHQCACVCVCVLVFILLTLSAYYPMYVCYKLSGHA